MFFKKYKMKGLKKLSKCENKSDSFTKKAIKKITKNRL